MLMSIDIANVLKHYDLGTLESATKAAHGFVNETVFVKTTKGRFVLRRNQRRLSEDTHRYRHNLLAWLEERQFPCPSFVPTRQGDTLLMINGYTYEIMPFIDAHDYNPQNPQHLRAIGRVLAEYHRAIEGFPPSSGEQNPRYHPHDVMALSERLLERDVMGDIYHELMWYDLRAAKLRGMLPDETYRRLPHLVAHGDVHRDNFLFHHNTVVALLDYDQATWDVRITDLADALVGFTTDCATKQMPSVWGIYKGPIDETCATELLTAYHAVAPLTPAEIMALPSLIELVWLQGNLGRVFSTPEGAPEYHQDVLNQGRWLSEWIQERSGHLIDRWLNIEREITNKPRMFPRIFPNAA
jgi:homoserine kinase type II